MMNKLSKIITIMLCIFTQSFLYGERVKNDMISEQPQVVSKPKTKLSPHDIQIEIINQGNYIRVISASAKQKSEYALISLKIKKKNYMKAPSGCHINFEIIGHDGEIIESFNHKVRHRHFHRHRTGRYRISNLSKRITTKLSDVAVIRITSI